MHASLTLLKRDSVIEGLPRLNPTIRPHVVFGISRLLNGGTQPR